MRHENARVGFPISPGSSLTTGSAIRASTRRDLKSALSTVKSFSMGTEPVARADASASARALSFEAVSVRYPGSERDALVQASLTIDTGGKGVIVGPNGSGKSTLLRAALGLTPISRGTVRVLGRDVQSIRGETGVGTNLEEVYRLMTIPVDGLISLWAGLKGGAEAKVRQWINEFGLTSVLDRPLFRLSTGQTKLIGDLLALGFSPGLLLLDEPFDNVDFGRRRQYIELLSRTSAAVLMNTHELDLLHSFPEWDLYFMFDGQLVGRFHARDIDRLYVNRGVRSGALATFRSSLGEVSVTLDSGDFPMKGASNLSYLLDRIA